MAQVRKTIKPSDVDEGIKITSVDETDVNTSKEDNNVVFAQNGTSLAGVGSQALGFSRMLDTLRVNKDIRDINIKGIEEATRAKMADMPTEIYSRQNINAGNAERSLAASKIKNLPPITSDYTAYASMQKVNQDESAQHLANAIRLESQQHSNYLDTLTNEKRTYADQRQRISQYNKNIVADSIAAKAAEDAKLKYSNWASADNYAREKQGELGQLGQQNFAANLSNKRLGWQNEAEQGYRTALIEKYGNAFAADKNKGNKTIEQWVITQPGYVNDVSALRKQWMQYPTIQENNFMLNRGFWFKSGGSIRSAKEQVDVNRNKSFDQNWVNHNKSVRKAIDKMNDNVHRLLIKMLSNEI